MNIYFIIFYCIIFIIYFYQLFWILLIIYIDMLTEVHTAPSQNGGCFYDYLTSETYFLRDSTLIKFHPDIGQQNISLPFNRKIPSTTPDQHLPKLTRVYGNVLINSQGTFASSSSDQECMIKSTNPVTDSMCWQFYFPVSLYGVQLGVFSVEPNGIRNQIAFEFNSSTSRTVTFMAQENKIYAWVNKSVPLKNHKKNVDYLQQKYNWYPYVKIKEQGCTAVFNPFAVEPNSTKTLLNPFNSHSDKKPAAENNITKFDSTEAKIKNLVQLDKDRMLLQASDNWYKLLLRNKETNQIKIPRIEAVQNTIRGLWNQSEMENVKKYCQNHQIQSFTDIEGFQALDYAFQNIEYLIKHVDKNYKVADNQIIKILLQKLLILRQYYSTTKIPNPIYVNNLDTQTNHYSKKFFEQASVAFKIDNLNEESWMQIQGKLMAKSQNYLCFITENDTIQIYHVGERIKKVFSHKNENKFEKERYLQNFSEKQLRIFKESNAAPHVFKILSNCLNENKEQSLEAFEPSEKNINELTKDFKIKQEDAIIALKECGNVEQALVWLSNPNRKVTRSFAVEASKSKKQCGKEGKNISIVQVKGNAMVRLLIQIDNQIYALGLSPKDTTDFVQKTEKGVMNLSTFSHECSIKNLSYSNWYTSYNHKELHILDHYSIPKQVNNILCLYREQSNFMIAFDQGGVLMKFKVLFNEEKTYSPKSSFEIQAQQEPFAQQFIDWESVTRTINGDLLYSQNWKNKKFHTDIVAHINNVIYSNFKSSVQSVLQFTLQIPELPKIFEEKEVDSTFIPLLVEKGPPGCNLNYPICSILYPKNPFLANYPFSLTLKNLHGKVMKINEVIIERIGNRKNVNQVKQGYIYFTNDSRIQSKKYKFVFDSKDSVNSLTVKIDEQNYWEYMIIEPIYATGKKMPYQIGFVGAKGSTMDIENYNSSFYNYIEKNILISNKNQNAKYQILNHSGAGKSSIKFQASMKDKFSIKDISIKGNVLHKTKKSKIKAQNDDSIKVKEVYKLQAEAFLKIYLRQGDHQLLILKEIANDQNFNFENYSNTAMQRFTDVVHFQKKLKPRMYEIILKKILKNQFGQAYIKEIRAGMAEGLFGFNENLLPSFLSMCSQEELEYMISEKLIKLPKFQKQKYQELHKRKIPYLILEDYFHSSYYFKKINSQFGESTVCKEIFQQSQIQNIQMISIREEYMRKLIVKLDSRYSISNILLRVGKSEMHLKSVINVYVYEGSQKVQINSIFVQEHQWIQIMKNPYHQEMIDMFGQNKGWLNGFGIDFNKKKIQCQYLEIEILFTVSGILAQKIESQNIPSIDIVPELYGSKVSSKVKSIKQKQSQAKLEQLFTMKDQQKFFLSSINLSNSPLNKYLVSKNNNTEYHYYESEVFNERYLRMKISEKIQNQQYDSAVSLHCKMMEKFHQPNGKQGLDDSFTILMLALERLNYNVPVAIAKKLVQVIIKKEIGPIQEVALKCVCPHIQSLIQSLPYISDRIPKIHNLVLTKFDILNVLKLKNPELSTSLTRLINKNLPASSSTIAYNISLSQSTQDHKPVLQYLLSSEKSAQIFKQQGVLEYLTGKVSRKVFEEHFINKLSESQLQAFIMECKKNGIRNVDYTLFLNKLLNMQSLEKVSLDLVPLLFEDKEANWDNLYKCIKLCPQAQDMIYCQYLSFNRDQPEQIIELVTFYRQILISSAKSTKNGELFAAFLSELFFIDKNIFMDVVFSLPKQIRLHEDIYDTIMVILNQHCMIGGIQGSKLSTLSQNKWLSVILRLLKMSPKQKIQNEETLIKWYLSNNDYELISTNPVNRSQAVNEVKEIGELIKQYLGSNPISISSILATYNQMKQKIKKNNHKLLSSKHIELNRLQHGVQSLLCNNVDPKELTEVFIGGQGNQGILKALLTQLQTEIHGDGSSKWENYKQAQLSQEMEGFCMQGQKLQNLNVKDWQSYKAGSKSVTCKVSIAAKKLLLKPKCALNMSKFLVGFNIQDNPEKNIFLPDNVELYGGQTQGNLQKLCDLQVIDDQHFYPFGVKVFAFNFNKINKNYKNGIFNVLELRMRNNACPSCSDVLQNYQKNLKNGIYNVSFISIVGHEEEPTSEPSYTSIYMKLLSFLSLPEYSETLKAITQKNAKYQNTFSRLVTILSDKSWSKKNKGLIQSLLIALNKTGQNVLQELINQHQNNNELIKMILKSNLTTQNLDTILNHTIEKNLTPETASDMIENIKIASHSPSKPKPSAIFTQDKIVKVIQNQNQSPLMQKISACILSTPSIYPINHKKIVEGIFNQGNKNKSYSTIASFVYSNSECLNWFLNSKKVDQISEELLSKMHENISDQKLVKDCFEEIYLLSSLATYSPIKNHLIEEKVPLKILTKLQSQGSLLIQYPKKTMKYFISLFQSTCIQSACAENFAERLIELMVKLPEISSTYHQYFIHEFFFPLINAYTGAPVTFVWRGPNRDSLSKVTQILQTLPIRSSDKVVEHNLKYYAPFDQNWNEYGSQTLLLRKEDKNVAERVNKVWKQLEENVKVKDCNEEWKIVVNQETINLKQTTAYSLLHLTNKDRTLLTNQTLLRIKKPSLFGKNYTSQLPSSVSIFDYLYLLPLEMTLNDVLRQFNICGFKLNQQSIKNIIVLNKVTGKPFSLDTKIGDIYSQEVHPFIELQIDAHSIFRDATIEKIAKSEQQTIPAFIPQQTIFKSFEKLKGLQKMIKVLITCVKNWSNQQQSKIWLQYLNELQSFSCFPVFSSIYMTKQSNVQLLFDLLSGLPDKQDPKKWTEEEKKAVRFLYDIIKNVFEVEGQQAIIIRNYAIQSGFYETMLQRLHLVTKEPKRFRNQDSSEEEQIDVPQLQKKNSEQQYKLQVKKKKGVGYGTDSSSNQKWDITGHEQARKQQSTQILGLLKILQKFLSHPKFTLPKELLQASFNSCLLPVLQSSLRGGSLLQISKYAQLFTGQLSFVKQLAKNLTLIPCLMQLPKEYEPKQSQSIHSLLKTLQGTSKIFLSCLTGSVSEKTSQEIAKNIIETYECVDSAISKYKIDNVDEDQEKRILELPLAKKYPILLKDLRFDYVDMKDKNGKMKHHYNSSYTAKHTSPAAKTIRLAQELADISHALPIDHTNAIYVRCDKERVDFMQALIMGSNGTPYGHGAYLFDIHFEDSYPNNPPKVNLTTTGSGSIRFNPNLYNCGKVCLSLLGTWRGSAMENWDPKVSTLLQVLVSIQSIIMSEEVYFNEPGFEHEQGTVEGQKKNEAYSNIVRYGNIKFAMLENLKNPPKGFETVIRRHFYLKKVQIMEQMRKWTKFAEKREASYTGLVSDHNHNWANTFNKSKKEYNTMLAKAISQLDQELNKLPQPSSKDFTKANTEEKKKEKIKKVKVEEKEEVLQEIDVTYEENKARNYQQLDINDEKVKDRWSRYIGAMGIEAVSKQSKANIILFGLDALGIEIAKNLVLSGCRKLAICENQNTSWNDLAGQFYLSEDDIGKNRTQACLYKLQELNNYVRVQSVKITEDNISELKDYHLVISTSHSNSQLFKLNKYCRENGLKFIVVKNRGPYGYVFNDFGQNFQVTDKNGEQTVQVMVQNITNEEQGVVTLLSGQRHSYEDGEAVRMSEIKGMSKKEGQGSLNGTIHKIKVINKHSFSIGNTTQFTPYEGNGLARNMKLPIFVNFKSLQQTNKEVNIDGNLQLYDFVKYVNSRTLHLCFNALDKYIQENKIAPRPWNWEDSEKLLELVKKEKEQLEQGDIKYIRRFSFTCSGTFAPLAAFYGGLIAQQAFKAITSKYMPINQYFFTQFTQVLPQLPKQQSGWKEVVEKMNYKSQQNRFQGLRSIVGDEVIEKIRNCKVFVIGSGAIGCQLLKNYAMISLATGQQKGQIIVTDPDHIETSNLNRQFLFREKHLQKPKSMTASAAVKQMNKYLKGKIKAKLTKVCEATKQIFSNEFFENLNIVTNALDNIQARQYVDMRCLQNKIALLESGTLSSKGHVQVIMPYKTETYGSKADPAEEGDIPHCTLKMFPEEALHCVEWARDIFGKTFTLQPKALTKIIQSLDSYTPNSSEKQVLTESLKMLEERPKNFDDCVFAATQQFFKLYRNDIKQLLYTYPLDSKTKDGKPFWKLPKRPPTPIEEILPENELHNQFITSFAVLMSKIYNVPFPKDFRTTERRIEIAKQASKIKIQAFVPSDKLAKQMQSQVENKQDKQEKEQVMQEKTEQQTQQNQVIIFKEIKLIVDEEIKDGNQIKIVPEQFEKDQDSNGHIDLIYSMANLRVQNYKLQPMDWITTKLKAGRITPALSTTTSCIAALQTIQLIKYLKGCTVQEMRNSFINLAVPMVQTNEPGQVQKIKIHENLTTNIWQRWEVGPVDKQITMGPLIQKIQEKYTIVVKVLNVVAGGPIFSDLVLGLESKKAERQALMKKKFLDIINEQGTIDEIKNFIDLTILIGNGEEIVKHVPTIRVILN